VNSYERVLKRLKGEEVDRPPNFDIFMTFAAHSIGQPLSRYYLDYQVLVDANLAMVENFQVDLVQAISDPYREAVGFGAKVEFPQDGLPVSKVYLLADPSDFKMLKKPDPATSSRMLDRLSAIQSMRERVGGQVPVMGWVEGALAEAGDLRGNSALLLDVYDRPEWLEELLEVCVEVEIEFARLQVQAGADIIGLGDAIASQMSPRMYTRFALPYEKRIFEAVHAMGVLARLHICGNTTKILPAMVESGADIIDLDWMVDMAAAVGQFDDRVSFCGNLDPVTVMLQSPAEQVYRATLACMQTAGLRSFSAGGCEIPDGTPPENIHAQARALQELGGRVSLHICPHP